MQVRLFRKAWKRWKKTLQECADLFDRYHVDRYISDAYELFHVQGDDANLFEIEQYLIRQGVTL